MSTINKIVLGLIFIMGISLVSCDEVPVVIPSGPSGPTEPVGGDTTLRVVLLQELTGVKCPNCPTGAAEAKRLLEVYDEQLAVIGVHGDFLTTPLPESQYDFRNEFSRTIESSTPFIGKPAGAVNRRQVEGSPFLAYDVDDWEPLIQQELEVPAEIKIEVDATESGGVISVDVELTPLIKLEGGYNIAVALTQGAIVDVQEETGNIIEDYEHEHVLRHMFTAALGDILGSDLAVDETITKSFTYTIPTDASPAYDLDHIEIVAYVTRDGASESPVIQVAKAHF